MINVIRMLTYDEGFRDMAYKDTVGKITVGIGFNMDDPRAREIWSEADIHHNFDLVYNRSISITKDEAWALLSVCIEGCKQDLKSLLHDFDTYPDYVQLALINLCYNMGLPKLCHFNTFLGRIRLNNFSSASDDLKTTLWAKQLPARAKRVCALLNNDDSFYG